MKKVVVTGLSIRKELLKRIEAERGDISRSKFLSRLVEHALELDNNEQIKKPLRNAANRGSQVEQSPIVKQKPLVERGDSCI